MCAQMRGCALVLAAPLQLWQVWPWEQGSLPLSGAWLGARIVAARLCAACLPADRRATERERAGTSPADCWLLVRARVHLCENQGRTGLHLKLIRKISKLAMLC